MIRQFPYPFASALAIVSDVDNSNKARYESYVGQIVRKHGLDFGDSVWLRTTCNTPPSDRPIATGLGFFSRFFGVGNDDAPGTLARVRTFLESIGEYHLGNLDHFHSFLSRGPRVAVVERGNSQNGTCAFDLEKCEMQGFWRCCDVYIEAVCVVLEGPQRSAIKRVIATGRDGSLISFDREVGARFHDDGRRQLMFAVNGSADDDNPHPRLDNIANLRIDFVEQGDVPDVVRVLLVSAPGFIVLDRLNLLRETFNVEVSLVTEHSGQHFRSAGMAERRDVEQEKFVEEHAGIVAALNGKYRTRNGELVFCTDADDPASVARVLPDLATKNEMRFFVPQAATSNTGLTIETVLQPLPTRLGTIAYQAHRTLPNLMEPSKGAQFDGTFSHQPDFAARLEKVLDASFCTPGLFWPIYTHLGAITVADSALPSPYFTGDALCRLQDRVFNICGSVASDARIWMTRATTLYEYALIRRSIPEHVTWKDPNTVEIASWQDQVLGKRLPRSPAQLYGLTFYVDDPRRARVCLDGVSIELLARNPADETGRCSVTITESEICHLIFDALDPLSMAGSAAELASGTWDFAPASESMPGFGRLAVSRGTIATLRLPMFGWMAEGAQLLSFIGRCSSGAGLALMLETETGGRFFFGDRAILKSAGPVSAHYVFEHNEGAEFRKMVAPFHCMQWTTGSAPGGPMPSHALASITLYCAGKRAAYADFGQLCLLRPRATSLNQEGESYCLGGRVVNFAPGQTVQAELQGKAGRFSAVVDQRGWFCFRKLEPGIYAVWTEREGCTIYDRRGLRVEVRGNVMTLALSRKSA